MRIKKQNKNLKNLKKSKEKKGIKLEFSMGKHWKYYLLKGKNKFIFLFNEKYILKSIPYHLNKIEILQNIDEKIINVYHVKNNFLKTLRDYLISSLYNYIFEFQTNFCQKNNFPIHEIKVKQRKSSWAVNYFSKKVIIYSLNLIFYNLEIINYVIIHELCHHYEQNHKKNFWNLVRKYISNYKILRKKMNFE